MDWLILPGASGYLYLLFVVCLQRGSWYGVLGGRVGWGSSIGSAALVCVALVKSLYLTGLQLVHL